ncbi:MAG: polyprenyl synthetase family protein [Candidatus Aenigmatarchaeota archaeon]
MVFELLDAGQLEDFLKITDEKVIEFAERHNLYEKEEALTSKLYTSNLYKYAKERFFKRGKRFRPAVTYASCKAISGEMEKATPFAVSIELIHNGYLDIDDVFDKSPQRRGSPATWTIVGPERAILCGLINCDVLPHIILNIGVEEYGWDSELLLYSNKLIGITKKHTVAGEYMDIELRRSPELNTDIQLQIYALKTGYYTVGCPMAGGARIGGASNETADKLFEIGKDIGCAFQIRDDLLNLATLDRVKEKGLDLKTAKTKYGKEPGDDLNEGKPTLPVAIFNERATEEDKKEFYSKFGRMDPRLTFNECYRLKRLLDKYDALNESEKIAENLLNNGMRSVRSIIPQTDLSRELYSLLLFASKREW